MSECVYAYISKQAGKTSTMKNCVFSDLNSQRNKVET